MAEPSPHPDALFLAFQESLAGRYSIVRELGRGGMGVVYLAREVHLDRPVAIKLLPPALAAKPGLRERFLREARLAARLSHPHIIPIHAVHDTPAFVYFVMAFVDGETLGERVHRRGPLSASDSNRLLREVAWALGHAHTQGLVHRDVKPDNILIEAVSGRALVADFGIAAITADYSQTADGIAGTPEFMSPEQALGLEVDARSDLYSLGATAFYMLTGRVPFEGLTAAEILARQCNEVAPSLTSSGAAVPRALSQLVERCLAKDPTARPLNAESLAEELGLSLQQRRELPAALRDFVKRSGRMDGVGTIAALSGTLVASIAAAATVNASAGLAVLIGSAVLCPIAFGLSAAGGLLQLGYAQDDLAPAFRLESERGREERLAQPGRLRVMLERLMARVARISAASGVGLLVLSVAANRSDHLITLALTCLATAMAAMIASLAALQNQRDLDVEFWGRFWTGRVGRWAFAVARRLRRGAPPMAAMTHRATELSLGLAAEQLFETLPVATRKALGDVPTLLQRLRRDATQLRSQLAPLQEHARAQHSAAAPSAEHCETAAAPSLAAVRTRLEQRLSDTVGAMESLRLNLLRLHAGSLSLERFTTQLEQAAQLSDDIDRLVLAHDEVEHVLRIPQALELTPV